MTNPITTRKIGKTPPSEEAKGKKTKTITKKVVYIEIDDEITAIYDRIKNLKMKNVYLVVPKRAILFQSIVNLKILKRKIEDMEKNIFIITNDQNGIHLASKIGLAVYDKLENHDHPSLVSGKFLEERNDISPLKASINTLDDEAPQRRNEKKFSITDLIKRDKKKSSHQVKNPVSAPGILKQKDKQREERGKLVLVAPNRQALISLVVVSVMILMIITYIALPGATIILTPKSNVITTSVNVVLADIEANRAELDIHPLHEIPSYSITKKISKVLTYQATGKEFHGQNATGIITVINTSTNDWPLLAKTRFQTGDGLVFRLQNPVTIPAAKADKPGTKDVPVVADEVDVYNQVIGEKGNIAPTKFFLPGLSAENQKKLYAENKQPFTSGKTLVSKLITKQDLEAANKKMAADLKDSALIELQAYVKEKNDAQKTNLVLLTGRDAIISGDAKVTVPPNLEGQKLETFEVKGEIIVNGIAYSKDELISILTTELKLKKSPQKRLTYIDADSLTYRIIDNDRNAKKIKITATIKGREEYEISPEKENGDRLIKKILEHIVGKEIKESESYIQNLPEIDKVKIESWPAWAPSLPGIPDNIKVEIKRESATPDVESPPITTEPAGSVTPAD